MTVRRALLSAYDKTDILGFAQELHRLGIELVASGGTAELIAGEGIPVTTVAELTGVGEMLGHRVVTLHPAIHAGILARRDVPEDAAELEQHGIAPIDLVYVNLYPFERTVGRLDVEWAEAIEQIDVGGPAMLRAAAKNHAFVVPLCRPEDFTLVLDQLRAGSDVDLETRRSLAARAFARTGSYDAAVSSWRPLLRTARTPIKGRRITPSAGRGCICCRASTSSRASRSRTTTSTTSRPLDSLLTASSGPRA
jgi:phosphoribosylaminoimidazolecarboxamide formyltransferase / IMP cyclohydrolase